MAVKTTTPGTVYLVGAGPGNPGLVTLRAKALIESCDVLVYDYLANPALIRWTRSDCEQIYVGKRPNLHAIPQEEIESILIDRASAGKNVVRLKGGDPFVFGRGGEEATQLIAAGLRFEIVPGVTAALGAASSLGLPLTHRDRASSVCFLTGHEDPEKHTMRVDFRRAAQSADTLCIYMGMGKLAYITDELMAGGLPADTPVALVQWATLATQKSLLSTLGQIADAKDKAGLGSPAVIIVGQCARYAESLAWFENRPLFGRRIAVTRNREGSRELSSRLQALGADTLELPLIEVTEAPDTPETDQVLSILHSYQWILFTSPNGVRHFFDKFFRRFEDLRDFGGMRIACIGDSTAREVRQQRLSVDYIPDKATAEDLAEGLLRHESLEHQNVLAITGNRNRDALPTILEKGMAIVDTLSVYQTDLNDLGSLPDAERFRTQGAHAITFTSASAVESFAAQAAKLQLGPQAHRPKTFSIGPLTSKAMKAKGIPVDAEASPHNLDGLIASLLATDS